MNSGKRSKDSGLRGPIIGAALLVVILVAGGLWQASLLGLRQPGDDPTPSSQRPSASPTQQPSASPTQQPSASPTNAWGPLAVIPPHDGADTLRDEGTLRITDACVYLLSRGAIELLFWPADRTRWSPESRTITFLNFDGTVVTVSDGDHIVLGGSGGGEAEGGISGEEWVRRIEWVAPPASSCPLAAWWYVGEVEDTTGTP